MAQIVVSEELARQIGAAGGSVDVVDASGAVIAVCTPVGTRRSPHSREEIERRREEARKNPELNMTTAEMLEYLRQLGEGRQ